MQSRVVLLPLLGGVLLAQDGGTSRLGREVAIERHLQDDEEFQIGIPDLIEFGRKLFTANWTVQARAVQCPRHGPERRTRC